jgi:NADPH-dependent 2,4-dienoyl-CoA reductase/sulfur reductase-like enzyme
MQQAGVVIIGGGLAGAQVAIQLRQRKFAGPVTMLSEESRAPYWRPPLSKSILEGTEDPQSAALRAAEFWQRRRIDLRLGEAALGLDKARKTVTTRRGDTLAYVHAVLATGAQCIIPPLPGISLPGVQVLRTLDDAATLRDVARVGMRIAILGGGFIGLEAASALTARGARVTVIEREPRLLARVAAPAMSWCHGPAGARGHRRRGRWRRCGGRPAGGWRDRSVRPPPGLCRHPARDPAGGGRRPGLPGWHFGRSSAVHECTRNLRARRLRALSEPALRQAPAPGVDPERH